MSESSNPLVFLSIFMPVPCCLIVSLKSGIVVPLALDFLLRIALAIQDLVCFHMYIRIDFSISVMSVVGILIGIAILTMLILPVHKHGKSYLLTSSSVSLFMVYCFH
jgi:hypothetical protein